MSFRLSVINPNSDRAVTEYLRAAAAGVLPDGSAVDAIDCPESPPVIETALDDVLAAPMVVAAATRAGDPDAFLIGCFGDPAVSALRELTAAPVVGLGQAALIEASLVSCRFGVITTLDRGIPALWSQLAGAGLAGACVAIGSVQSAPGDPPLYDPEPGEANGDDLLSRLTWQGRRLLGEGADGLVLACAGFGRSRERLAAALDVPVCDGIAVGACLAYGLAASGARTSKRGGYGWPGRDITSVLSVLAGRPAVTPSEPGS
jgi:allantoin racemase